MHGNDTRRRTDVAVPLARFALAGLLAVVVVGAIGVCAPAHGGPRRRDQGRDDAREARRQRHRRAGRDRSACSTATRARSPRSTARRAARSSRRTAASSGSSSGTATGRIVYSDEPRADRPALRAAARTSATRSRRRRSRPRSATSRAPRTASSAAHGKLLEVYLPIRAPSGQPLLFETLPGAAVGHATRPRRRVLAFAPALIGALLLLELLQLPLAYSHGAAGCTTSRQEREALLLRALDASDTERRRIAGDLHDGVVQDLAGTSYALAARGGPRSTAEAPEVSDACATARGRHAVAFANCARCSSTSTRPTCTARASPPPWPTSSRRCESRGVAGARRRCRPACGSSPTREALMFRTAQEALRNVMAHSDADHVDVSVVLENSHAGLTIARRRPRASRPRTRERGARRRPPRPARARRHGAGRGRPPRHRLRARARDAASAWRCRSR